MSVQDELDRLDALGTDLSVSDAQRQAARAAWDKLNDDLILVAWADIEARGAQFDALIARLSAVVDDIAANRLTTAIDDINGVLNDVQAATTNSTGPG